jgi:hypothetical protein
MSRSTNQENAAIKRIIQEGFTAFIPNGGHLSDVHISRTGNHIGRHRGYSPSEVEEQVLERESSQSSVTSETKNKNFLSNPCFFFSN